MKTTLTGLLRALVLWAYLTGDGPPDATPPESAEGWRCLKGFNDRHDLARPTDHYLKSWASECRWARSAYREALSLPPLADAAWLPTRAVAEERLAFAQAYLSNLQQVKDDSAKMTAWRREAEHCYWACYWVRQAHVAGPYPLDRRRALGQLRALLGPANYYAGAFPPPAPAGRFEGVPWDDAKVSEATRAPEVVMPRAR